MGPFVRAIRPHHWLKNILVFIPLFASHQFVLLSPWRPAVVAFGAFSLTASAGYLINDLADLAADRNHPVKCRRPLASGALQPWQAVAGVFGLLLAAGLLAFHLGVSFLEVLGIYFAASLLYSLWLKKVALLDVLLLGLLYTMRIIAGCFAIRVQPSFWLLAFSLFFFLNIALVKRFVELTRFEEAGTERVARRGYMLADQEVISSMGMASGYISVLVLALYVNSSEILDIYPQPRCFWLLCLFALYWNSRLWFLAHRRMIDDDPVLFAVRDKISWLLALSGILIILVCR